MTLLQKIFSALALGLACSAQATTITLHPGETWNEFTIDDFSSATFSTEWIDSTDSNSPDFGSPLHFTFTIPHSFTGFLSIVDGGFAGDRFEISNRGASLGISSHITNTSDFSNDFSTNWNNPHFSKAYFNLPSGSYDITGNLFNTLQNFNSTNGALKLQIVGPASLPEPSPMILLVMGIGLMALMRLRT